MEKTNYTIFLSGQYIPDHLLKYGDRIIREPHQMDFMKFGRNLEQAKVVFIPGLYDASPRVIT